jgi:hypothetical protein
VRRSGAFAGVGVLAVVAVLFLAVTPGYATSTAPSQVTAKFSFPSSTSTVVGSTGFIDDHQVGYFWSAARGDRVSQTVSGPAYVKKAILRVYVVTNALSNGAHVSWDLVINAHVVGHFNVAQGFTGPKTVNVTFHRIVGPSYDVTIRVTNEVAGGEGSHTLAYAGAYAHSITLRKNV